VLLFAEKPVAMVVLFTVIGAFSCRSWPRCCSTSTTAATGSAPLRNDAARNAALVVALALFGWIAITELVDVFCK